MKRFLVALLAACLAASSPAVQVQMDDDEQAACEAQGGCVFATREHLRDLLKQAYEAGVHAANQTCASRT